MAPQPQPQPQSDPVGELMAGVERYLAGLPDDAYAGLIAAVEKARGKTEGEGTQPNSSSEYPSDWDQPGVTGRTRGGK